MTDPFDEVVPPPAAARFCGRCGGVLLVGDAGCATCLQAEADALEAPAQTKPERPGFGMAMLLFGILLASFLPYAFASIDDTIAFVYRLQNAIQIFDTLVVLGFALFCWQATWPLIKTVPITWSLTAIPSGLITLSIAVVLLGTITTLTGYEEEFLMIQPAFDAGYGWVFLILTIVAQPAIIEELAFRGIIFDGARKVLSDRETVIVTALMFMVLHLNPAAFPHLFIMGLVLGWLRLKTGSLWPCILLHATHNGLAIAYEYWVYH